MDEKIMAVVLAAGKGTRLRTEGVDTPKVLRKALGRPLLAYVLDAISFIEKENTTLVVGYKKEAVMAAFSGYRFAEQAEQLGTGHAVLAAKQYLADFDGPVLVCCGDMPLIRRSTYEALVQAHLSSGNACTILTGTSSEPLPYGRVLRDENGDFVRMAEERDATPEQLQIRELNSGVYVFESVYLLRALSQLRSDNAQGEYYLTDVPAILSQWGLPVGICCRDLGTEIIGVNTIEQLQQVESILKGGN